MAQAEEDLIDYEDEEIPTTATNGSATATTESKDQKGSYVGVHR